MVRVVARRYLLALDSGCRRLGIPRRGHGVVRSASIVSPVCSGSRVVVSLFRPLPQVGVGEISRPGEISRLVLGQFEPVVVSLSGCRVVAPLDGRAPLILKEWGR